MASNAETVSIWWRHRVKLILPKLPISQTMWLHMLIYTILVTHICTRFILGLHWDLGIGLFSVWPQTINRTNIDISSTRSLGTNDCDNSIKIQKLHIYICIEHSQENIFFNFRKCSAIIFSSEGVKGFCRFISTEMQFMCRISEYLVIKWHVLISNVQLTYRDRMTHMCVCKPSHHWWLVAYQNR